MDRIASKNADPLTASAQGIASFINRMIIGHPCMVLRRQCQVHQMAKKIHLTPFTLVPSVINIITKDGIVTLWKGSIGCGVLWALSQIAEIVIADVFNLPKTVVPDGSRQRFWRHVMLKSYTYFFTTPFIVSSFVETVRSNTGFSTEDTRVLDVVVRGIDRIRFDFFGAKDSSRRFSILHLSIPTVAYFTSHFLIVNLTYDIVHGMARRYVSRKLPQERTRFHTIMPEMFATLTSNMFADFACYPVETVLHRMYIQGTRTLIDNLDNGVSAISVTTRYTGFFQCFHSIIRKEGVAALFSGVGAVILQYTLQFCVLNILKAVFNHGTSIALHVNTTSPRLGGARSGPSSSTTHPSLHHHFSAADMDWTTGGGMGGDAIGPSGKLSPIFNSGAVGGGGSSAQVFGGFRETGNAFGAGSSSPPNFSSLLQTRDTLDQYNLT